MLSTINSGEEKTYIYAYLGVLPICGVQRDLVSRIKLLCNWLKYERFTVGL